MKNDPDIVSVNMENEHLGNFHVEAIGFLSNGDVFSYNIDRLLVWKALISEHYDHRTNLHRVPKRII